jgi:hypothetical protein
MSREDLEHVIRAAAAIGFSESRCVSDVLPGEKAN